MADEVIELLDESGNFTGVSCLKSEAHRRGNFHASIQIWFYTADRQLLLQQRVADKETHPNLWDVSVAGHITFGERPLKAAVREAEEELGIVVAPQDLILIKRHFQEDTHPNGIIDKELNFVYACLLKEKKEDFKLQAEEVAGVQWVDLAFFKKDLNIHRERYVPRTDAYYDALFHYLE